VTADIIEHRRDFLFGKLLDQPEQLRNALHRSLSTEPLAASPSCRRDFRSFQTLRATSANSAAAAYTESHVPTLQWRAA